MPHNAFAPTLPSTPVAPILGLPQRFDVHEIDPLADRLAPTLQQLRRGGLVALDASAVTLIDHAGIEMLIATRLACLDAGADLRLVSPSTAVQVILELTGDAAALALTTDEAL